MLSNLDKQLRGAEVIEETICNHRGMWIKPYQVGLGFDTRDGASP